MKKTIRGWRRLVLFGSMVAFGWLQVTGAAQSGPEVQDNTYQRADKTIYTLWHDIPFFPLGDIGQYEKTMSQDRDETRKMLWNELMSSLEKLAAKGATVEVMLEPMANILMMFDQVHDAHKAKDVINIDKSMEAQFKASLDRMFRLYDVRDDKRKIQIGSGTRASIVEKFIREKAAQKPLGGSIKMADISAEVANEMMEQIDFVAYGTFSSLGSSNFQITFHVTGNKNGVTRSFVSAGRLTEALDDIAKQVFDFFQKNVYPDWETPYANLTWLAMPVNPNRSGYTWEEANHYCRVRGYRLPFARELILAESGGAYKSGGIGNLEYKVSYPVADKRFANDNYVYTAGNESATGGPIQGASYSMQSGKFWCVKGAASENVLVFENLWSLIRKYHATDREVYRALDTIRYELGDFGSDGMLYYSVENRVLQRMESLTEALDYLASQGIKLEIPSSLR